jgi:hypothetical protein
MIAIADSSTIDLLTATRPISPRGGTRPCRSPRERSQSIRKKDNKPEQPRQANGRYPSPGYLSLSYIGNHQPIGLVGKAVWLRSGVAEHRARNIVFLFQQF